MRLKFQVNPKNKENTGIKHKEQSKRSNGDISYLSKDFGKTIAWAPLESFGAYIDKM